MNKMASPKEVNKRLTELKKDRKDFIQKYTGEEYFYNAEIEILEWVVGDVLYCIKCGMLKPCAENNANRGKWLCSKCRPKD